VIVTDTTTSSVHVADSTMSTVVYPGCVGWAYTRLPCSPPYPGRAYTRLLLPPTLLYTRGLPMEEAGLEASLRGFFKETVLEEAPRPL